MNNTKLDNLLLKVWSLKVEISTVEMKWKLTPGHQKKIQLLRANLPIYKRILET